MSIPARFVSRRASISALIAVAICGALFSASASSQQAESTVTASLTVVDPYLLTIPASHELTASAVVAGASGTKATAKGIVADGTSAAVAVFESSSNKAITFTPSNAAKVGAYSASFLTTVTAGKTSVTVTPTAVGGKFYALALVTSGVAPDAEHGVDTIVTATQAASPKITKTFSLVTLPTPVVLVHGLWGDAASLGSTEGYLKGRPAFTSNRELVTPICYSVYLAFDAATDTLPGHGSGCEMTSAQALNEYFTAGLYKTLDSDHYVGGRVDVVAHSMGGLVARHYASVTGYKSVRNRMLGAFRNVVTLDTPETGSALATYLDKTAYNRTLQASFLSLPYELWVGFCGTDSSITLGSCFDSNGLPLSYPSEPLDTGAVWSLIPGGVSIAHAPAADSFNTAYGKWFAIASNFKDGDQPPALLRDVLNTVTAATYSSNPPTVDGILETPDDDVIVTVNSQSATAVAAQTKAFKDLQHTPAPGEASLLFGSDSNASVVDSADVNAQVAYWLGLQTAATPATSGHEAGQAALGPELETAENAATRPRFVAPDRITAIKPESSAGLGQPLRIALRFNGPPVRQVFVTQSDARTGVELSNFSGSRRVGSGPAPLLSQASGQAEIEITPVQAGPVRLKISVLFADGGLSSQTITLQVAPSARGLNQFSLNRGSHPIALVLENRDEDREAALHPVVEYDSLEYPVYLDGTGSIQLTVDQPQDDPVIRVSPTGLAHALRPGKALITGDFDGVRDSVEVEVYTKADAPAGYRRAED